MSSTITNRLVPVFPANVRPGFDFIANGRARGNSATVSGVR